MKDLRSFGSLRSLRMTGWGALYCHPDKAHSKIVILSEAEGSEFLRFAALSQDDRMGRSLRMGRSVGMTRKRGLVILAKERHVGVTFLCWDDLKRPSRHSSAGWNLLAVGGPQPQPSLG